MNTNSLMFSIVPPQKGIPPSLLLIGLGDSTGTPLKQIDVSMGTNLDLRDKDFVYSPYMVYDQSFLEIPTAAIFDSSLKEATAECRDFCQVHGLVGTLRTYLKRTREIFSNVESLSAELDYFQDEGDDDEGHIVLRLRIRSDQRTALHEYNAWVNWDVENIDPDESMYFALSFNRV
jgi:hypothetical protein